MSDEPKKEEPKKETTTELSNSDVKSHPLFVKATSTLQKKLDAFEAEKLERAAKLAEEQSNFEEAKRLYAEQAVKKAQEEWEQSAAVKSKLSDAKLELVKAGIKDERFIRGALLDFDPEKMEPADFAKTILDDESVKPFLSTTKAPVSNPDPHPATSSNKVLSEAEINALRASDKPEDRDKGHAAAEAAWIAKHSTG